MRIRGIGSLIRVAALMTVAAAAGFAEDAPALAPTWLGVLDTGAVKLRVAFHFAAANGESLRATMDSLDQGAMGIPIEEARLKGEKLHLGLTRLRAQYDAVLDASGTEMAGEWKQGGAVFPLRLRAVAAIEAPRRPQEPRPPFPYETAEVKFPSMARGITLAGTLTLPRGAARVPAVALLTGSGPQDRDETLLGHKPFLLLADTLTRAGLAVLRFDDRGVGGSSPGPEGATSRDFADDALGAVAFLRAQPRVDPDAVGLLGHSEGGLIAAIAAARSPDIAFIVMLAGPGLPGEKLLELQTAAVLRSSAASEEKVRAAVDLNRKIYSIALEEKDREKAAAAIRALLDERGIEDKAQEAQISQILSPWYLFFLGHDPAEDLALVRVPVLAVNGGTDVQVVAGPNLEAVRAALDAGGNADHRVVELPGLNHLLQRSATGAVSEYGKIEQTMDPSVRELVSGWITAHAGKQRP